MVSKACSSRPTSCVSSEFCVIWSRGALREVWARRSRRHIFIDIRPRLRYHPHRIPLVKDVGRRHRPTERVRFPRARARHLRSRAASEQRPAGTMTGLRGARWTGTGNSASQEARPELSCGVGSLQQAPRWNADRRRVAWILCAQTCVHLSAWTRAAPPPLSSPHAGEDEGGGAEVGDTRLPAFRLLFFCSPDERSEIRDRRCKPRDRSRISLSRSSGRPLRAGPVGFIRATDAHPGYGLDFAARDHGDAGPTAGLT